MPKPDPFSSSLHADDVQPAPGVPAGALTELQILLAAEAPREGLLIARRESELLQEGLPDWARGMQPAKTLGPTPGATPRLASAVMEFPQDEIVQRLSRLGLPLDSSLSVIAVELLPELKSDFADPLGRDLGQVRILRTSPLTAVPAICPPETA